MSEVTCRNCGHQNQGGANFCSSCGRPVAADPDEPTTMTFAIDADADDEVDVPLPPAGNLGKLVVTRGPNSGSEFTLEHVANAWGPNLPLEFIVPDDAAVAIEERLQMLEQFRSEVVTRLRPG